MEEEGRKGGSKEFKNMFCGFPRGTLWIRTGFIRNLASEIVLEASLGFQQHWSRSLL